MMYDYKEIKSSILTDDGQRKFLKIRDEVIRFLKTSGAFMMDKIVYIISGDPWFTMACVDRMVELGEIIELTDDPNNGPCQYRIFIKSR